MVIGLIDGGGSLFNFVSIMNKVASSEKNPKVLCIPYDDVSPKSVSTFS